MPQAEFSLKERDNIRYVKDRIARLAVTAGGVGVLFALLLMFFYLLSIALPIFSSAKVEPSAVLNYSHPHRLVALGIDDYGENGYVVSESGELAYLGFDQSEAETLTSTQIVTDPSTFAKGDASQGWLAFGTQHGEVVAVRPHYTVSFTEQGRVLSPDIDFVNHGDPILLDEARQPLQKLTFAVTPDAGQGVFVAVTQSGTLKSVLVESAHDQVTATSVLGEELPKVGEVVTRALIVPRFRASIEQLQLSPDGNQLFVLSGGELVVAQRKNSGFVVREVIDVSQGDETKAPIGLHLLAGAQSVLVTHKDHSVSQWFDVLNAGERQLTFIRRFELEQDIRFIVPDVYRKGFYAFHTDGLLQSIYTTSENLVLSEPVYPQSPDIAAISANEAFLLASSGHSLMIHSVDNPYPEISFSSLWHKVWYENYPEPDYVWQSTSADNTFEAKFSLIPIAFGTLKAAAFAMLISVPLAVFGAVYTAYFMSAPMRKVVKPAIEIMEALPTVIIGFLAGLWLAPIIERNLSGVMALVIGMPVAFMLVAMLWAMLPKRMVRNMRSGWHGIILIPVVILVGYLAIISSSELERWLFAGDVRVFLAEYGIHFDQRNALVVGIAMGFAVIPTIFTIAEDAVFSVPKHLSDGSLALGATQWQTLVHVVILTASPGIFSAIMIGLGRAVGETMIVLMATGNTPILDWNIFEGMRSLSATIAVELPESEVGSSHYRLLFLAALLLFMFTFAVNSLAEVVRQRLRERYRAL